MKKKNKFIILLLLLSLTTSLFSNSEDRYFYNKELRELSRDIYIAQEQSRLLQIRCKKERNKSFNNRTFESCIRALKNLRNKEISLIREKNRYINLRNHNIRIEKYQRREARREQKKIYYKNKAYNKKISKKKSNIKVDIDLSQQKMFVYEGNNLLYTWLVSTAKKGYNTPKGSYKPYHLEKMHYSKLYDNSPMPYSIFFKGGYAIHGTNNIKHLGKKASHGCVRLKPSNAKKLYNLVKDYGYKRTSIKIRS